MVTFYRPQQQETYTNLNGSENVAKQKGFNESYNGFARVIDLCTFPSKPTQNNNKNNTGALFL